MDIETIVIIVLCVIAVIIAVSDDTQGWNFLSRLELYATIIIPAVCCILYSIIVWG